MMAVEEQLIIKNAVFQESMSLGFSMATLMVILRIVFKSVCASFMWVSKHRMPSGEITQGNSLVKKQSKAPVRIEAEHQTLAIELSVYV